MPDTALPHRTPEFPSALSDFLQTHREAVLDACLSDAGIWSASDGQEPPEPVVIPAREALQDLLDAACQLLQDPGGPRPFPDRPCAETCRSLFALKRAVQRVSSDLASPELLPEGGEFVLDDAFDHLLLRMLPSEDGPPGDMWAHLAAGASGTRTSENPFQTLVETMNEGLTAISAEGSIVLFNGRMEQITGYSREEIIGGPLERLYPADSLSVLAGELERRRMGERSSYEITLAHKDGRSVPVRVSGAPLHDERGRYIGSFGVVTDISRQVQAGADLRESRDQVARLLDAERRRAAHTATINQVARMALSTLDPDEILRRVVHAVQEHFGYHHTCLFLAQEGSEHIVMRARAGAYEPFFPVGYAQQIGTGIVGCVVETGEPIVANDVSKDPRRILAFPEEHETQAELCVPIKLGDRVIGALDVQSDRAGAFGDEDLESLLALADQIAWVIHNAQLFQQTLHLKEFTEQTLQAVPLPILLLDRELRVFSANRAYLGHHELDPDDLIGRPLVEAVPKSHLVGGKGREALDEVLETGEPVFLERVTVRREAYQNRVVNLVLNRVDAADGPLALVVIEDITESLEKAYESSLLRRIGQIMQGILDPNRLLYTILTCVTAGTALGFNRAILLRVDLSRRTLDGQMGVGPSSGEEAARIWSELAEKNPTVDEILVDYDRIEDLSDTPLSRAARQISISLDETEDVLVRTVRELRPLKVTDDEAISISPSLWSALGTHHFVAVPLVARERAIGVIVADNLYSGSPVTDDSVDLLIAFAGHAALALENAELYQKLQGTVREVEEAYLELERTQKELVVSERLAVVGEMSARMAHEIRNPMTTIGGFARSILQNPDPERVRTGAGIIVEEVERLEKLLADTLSFTRPSHPLFSPVDLNGLISDVRALIDEGDLVPSITVSENLDARLPPVSLEPAQMKQVLLNILQNAEQAMPGGGEVAVSTRVLSPPPSAPDQGTDDGEAPPESGPEWVEIEIGDTGEGISPENLDQLFSPFFTTKTYGTGLGLPISKKIVDDHGGNLLVESQPGCGTTVHIQLPLSPPHPGG